MYHEYPYTTYYNDIDKLCKACKAVKLKLDTNGNYLRLIDADGNVLSNVQITYADTALNDMNGRPIKSYIISAATNGNYVVLTHGDGTITSFEIPFATTAEKDVQNKDILNYVYNVSTSDNKLRIIYGDNSVLELTIPFATMAATDVNGRDLTTYAVNMFTDGKEVVLADSKGNELSRITIEYADKASKDDDGNVIKSTYGSAITTGTTTIKLVSKDGTSLSEVTVPYATKALEDSEGNKLISDYAKNLVIDSDGKKIGVEAHDGTRLATITVPFATLSTDASNAIENIEVSGNQIIFTTYDGKTYNITAPYANKAMMDDAGHTIKSTYFAGVSSDTDAGTITFYDALGNVLAVLQNGTITHAIYDNYDNAIADYIKTITNAEDSDYIAVTHGNGTVDSIVINYATHAYKDTNENVIKNVYVKRLEIKPDPDDKKWKLFAYNGDNPEALIYSLTICAENANRDVNNRLITSYVGAIGVNDSKLIVKDGEDNNLKTISATVTTTPSGMIFTEYDTEDVDVVSTPVLFSYDEDTKTLNITSATKGTVKQVSEIRAKLVGDRLTNNVDFEEEV